MKNKYLNEEGEFMIRCSALGSVMASPKKAELSVGAKTYVKNAFKETYLEYETIIESPKFDKGNMMENEAIELISLKYGEPYVKNEEARTNGFIKGTCDVEFGNKIRDVKCPWNKSSFPLMPEDAKSTNYEWQGRGYMMLWDKEEFYLDYCLMDTPRELVPNWEGKDLHIASGLPTDLRVTTMFYKRELDKEQQIIQRVKMCRQYWEELKLNFKIK
jgi:hypothetical protein